METPRLTDIPLPDRHNFSLVKGKTPQAPQQDTPAGSEAGKETVRRSIRSDAAQASKHRLAWQRASLAMKKSKAKANSFDRFHRADPQ
jgi:hypothetical protein